MKSFNTDCISQTAATIISLFGNIPSKDMAQPLTPVTSTAKIAFDNHPCDRIFFYNPDAIAQWIYEKYRDMFAPIHDLNPLFLPMLSIYPPVTPVCFASMYSGLSPDKHGITKYEKPVLSVQTIFDILPRLGKKVAIISTANDSISMIFLKRPVDYYIYKTKEACNGKAMELIENDQYDFITLYNGDYDHYMHRCSPTGNRALKALAEDIETFCSIHEAIGKHWTSHNTVLAFAPDHGCHEIHKFLGSHGINRPCDMNTVHFYTFLQQKASE